MSWARDEPRWWWSRWLWWDRPWLAICKLYRKLAIFVTIHLLQRLSLRWCASSLRDTSVINHTNPNDCVKSKILSISRNFAAAADAGAISEKFLDTELIIIVAPSINYIQKIEWYNCACRTNGPIIINCSGLL